MIRLILIPAAIVIKRALEVAASMDGKRPGQRARLALFAFGYASLAACTFQAVLDAWAGTGSWLNFGFVVSSAMLIIGDKRRRPTNCFVETCPRRARIGDKLVAGALRDKNDGLPPFWSR